MVEKVEVLADVGSWVRMRRWPHQGDPAKVLDVEQASQRAEIRFVPRLDYMEMSQRATANLGEEGQRKKQTKKIAGVKPPARSALCPHISHVYVYLLEILGNALHFVIFQRSRM